VFLGFPGGGWGGGGWWGGTAEAIVSRVSSSPHGGIILSRRGIFESRWGKISIRRTSSDCYSSASENKNG